MSVSFQAQQKLIHVRFEQARGRTGVPKTWIPFFVGHPNDANAKPAIATLVRMAVGNFRAQCSDPNQGHGRDLMPGTDDEYELHNVDGNALADVGEITWETINVAGHNETRAELVLVWKSPAELLAAAR